MHARTTAAALLALGGVAIARGYVPAWPFNPLAGLLLALPLAVVLLTHVRQARQRRLRRYGLGW